MWRKPWSRSRAARSLHPAAFFYLLHRAQQAAGRATQGAATAEPFACVRAGGLPASLPPSLPLPTRAASSLLTSCPGHLLEPSTLGQQHSVSGNQQAKGPPPPQASATAQERKWAGERPPGGVATCLSALLPPSADPAGHRQGSAGTSGKGVFCMFACYL